MAREKELSDMLRDEILKIERKLGKVSLARLSKGAQRDFLSGAFIKRFKGVSSDDFDGALETWMRNDRPKPISVQTVLQVMIDSGNHRCVDIILDGIDARIGGSVSPTDRSVPKEKRPLDDAWWAECVLEPFENSFQDVPRLRRRVKYLSDQVRELLPATETSSQ